MELLGSILPRNGSRFQATEGGLGCLEVRKKTEVEAWRSYESAITIPEWAV